MSVIEKAYELEAYFHDSGKPRELWRVGTEYEKVGIDRSNLIGDDLAAHAWARLRDKGHIAGIRTGLGRRDEAGATGIRQPEIAAAHRHGNEVRREHA